MRFCKVAVRVTAIRPEARTSSAWKTAAGVDDGRLAKWNEDARAREIVFRARKKRYYCECRPRVYVHSVHHFHPRATCRPSPYGQRPPRLSACPPALVSHTDDDDKRMTDRRRRRDVTIASSAVGAPSDLTPSRRAYTTATTRGL